MSDGIFDKVMGGLLLIAATAATITLVALLGHLLGFYWLPGICECGGH